MAESLKSIIEHKLNSGFEVKAIDHEIYGVVSIAGSSSGWVVDPASRTTIRFRDKDDHHGRYINNLMAALRRAGAVKEPQNRKRHTPKPERKVALRAPKNAVIIAEETLRDPKATPRERALARNFLSLLENHQSVRKLAQRLGERLKEIERSLD